MDEHLTLVIDENLLVRRFESEDAERLSSLLQKEYEYLRLWLPEYELTEMVRDVKGFIVTGWMRFIGNGAFDAGIWYHEQLVGSVSLLTIDPVHRSSAIGYWLDREYQGMGLITQSVKRVIDYAFTIYRLEDIRIYTAVNNQKSRAVAERLSFEFERIEAEAERINGEICDDAVYVLCRANWPVAVK